MSFFDAAAELVGLGFKVFPLVPGKTMPLVKWRTEASDSLELIAAWSERYPDANIAMATGAQSGVIVVDVDMKNGKDGRATLEELAKQGKTLPPSPTSVTPTGGWHRYFRAVPGIRNVVEVSRDGRGIGPGIDIRADGGMDVLPPSQLSSGRGYRWDIPPLTADFPRLPDWAVKMLQPRPRPSPKFSRVPRPEAAEGYRRQALTDLQELTIMMATMNDGRHEAPFRMACRIGCYQAHGHLSSREIEKAFLDASDSNGALSKYARRDLRSQIGNGLRYAQKDGLPPLREEFIVKKKED
jgi:hypothetical protein